MISKRYTKASGLLKINSFRETNNHPTTFSLTPNPVITTLSVNKNVDGLVFLDFTLLSCLITQEGWDSD